MRTTPLIPGADRSSTASLASLRFENRFVQALPADSNRANHPRPVTGAAYSWVQPTPAPDPKLLAVSAELCQQLGIDVRATELPEFLACFAGNRLLPGMEPFAMCYGGHQFGHWAGQLGDGRAINLGELVDPQGRHWTLQLKGAGLTPYSRTADGLAVLRSSLREFLCSEAMYHLGVPTTRALSLIATGQSVVRDMFYDGRARYEPGAVVCRVAPSFTRFGNFQIFAARQELELLKRLADHTLATDFPHLGPPGPETYVAWFREVCQRTATMIVDWMRVGFVHGVMNTDNMSILGLTIDYGPYGWLEGYDPDWTPNTTDAEGRRYRFGNQPQVALWNLVQLANALVPLVERTEPLEEVLKQYWDDYQPAWQTMMASKLGWLRFEDETDRRSIEQLLSLLQATETDMTIFFRQLARLPLDRLPTEDTAIRSPGAAVAGGPQLPEWLSPLRQAFYQPSELDSELLGRWHRWLLAYRQRVERDGSAAEERQQRMDAVNPRFVPRNYLAQLAIDAAEQGDMRYFKELFDTLKRPYTEQPGREAFAEPRPEWARSRAGCSMLSCSS
jgi:serine/tyrosine/threonine adenylyltransferase